MKTTYGIRSMLVYAPGLGSLLLATCLSSIALGQGGGGGMDMAPGGNIGGVTGMPGGMGGMGGGM
jgi:hypothetical protein